MRHCPRRGGARLFGLSGRNERSRLGHLVGGDQAGAWRPALSRTLRVPAGARSAGRARGAVGAWRRTSSGRCASCCRTTRGCGRPGCCGSGLFLYDHMGGRKLLPPTKTLDLRRDAAGKPLKPRLLPSASNIPTAGSTMRGSWRSTPATRPTGAPRFMTRTKVTGAGATADSGASRSQDRDTGVCARGRGAAAGQCRRAVGRQGDCPRCPGRDAQRMPPGQGQPHRRANASTTTTGAISSRTPTAASSFAIPYERDFTLIGTTDLDYHGDPADGGHHVPRKSTICSRRANLFRQAGDARPGRLDLFRRAAAVRRRGEQGAGGDARLCAEAGEQGRAIRRCSTCSAAS